MFQDLQNALFFTIDTGVFKFSPVSIILSLLAVYLVFKIVWWGFVTLIWLPVKYSAKVVSSPFNNYNEHQVFGALLFMLGCSLFGISASGFSYNTNEQKILQKVSAGDNALYANSAETRVDGLGMGAGCALLALGACIMFKRDKAVPMAVPMVNNQEICSHGCYPSVSCPECNKQCDSRKYCTQHNYGNCQCPTIGKYGG